MFKLDFFYIFPANIYFFPYFSASRQISIFFRISVRFFMVVNLFFPLYIKYIRNYLVGILNH